MRRSLCLVVLLWSVPGSQALAQDTATGGRKPPAPALSDPVTLTPQIAVPRCSGYWLQVVNRTGFPLQVSIGKVILGTAAPDQRAWSFRIPSEMIDPLPARGVTFRSVGGPAPSEALLWDEFRVRCGR